MPSHYAWEIRRSCVRGGGSGNFRRSHGGQGQQGETEVIRRKKPQGARAGSQNCRLTSPAPDPFSAHQRSLPATKTPYPKSNETCFPILEIRSPGSSQALPADSLGLLSGCPAIMPGRFAGAACGAGVWQLQAFSWGPRDSKERLQPSGVKSRKARGQVRKIAV